MTRIMEIKPTTDCNARGGFRQKVELRKEGQCTWASGSGLFLWGGGGLRGRVVPVSTSSRRSGSHVRHVRKGGDLYCM